MPDITTTPRDEIDIEDKLSPDELECLHLRWVAYRAAHEADRAVPTSKHAKIKLPYGETEAHLARQAAEAWERLADLIESNLAAKAAQQPKPKGL